MARATQSKTIRIISEIDGSPINSGLVQLKRGATAYNMVSVGNGYFRNEAVLPGEYKIFYDSADTNATEAVGAGEVDRLDTSENINSIYVTGPSGTPELSPFISISNVENLQTELDGKLEVDGSINSTTGINSDIQGALNNKVDEGGDISSTTGINSDIQDALDSISSDFAYAGIYVDDGATAQSIATGATYTKLTGFTLDQISRNATSDVANDQIVITELGDYDIGYSISYQSGTPNITFEVGVFGGLTGAPIEQPQIHTDRKLSSADTGSASGCGLLRVTAVPYYIDLRASHDSGTSVNLTMVSSSLIAKKLGI